MWGLFTFGSCLLRQLWLHRRSYRSTVSSGTFGVMLGSMTVFRRRCVSPCTHEAYSNGMERAVLRERLSAWTVPVRMRSTGWMFKPDDLILLEPGGAMGQGGERFRVSVQRCHADVLNEYHTLAVELSRAQQGHRVHFIGIWSPTCKAAGAQMASYLATSHQSELNDSVGHALFLEAFAEMMAVPPTKISDGANWLF